MPDYDHTDLAELGRAATQRILEAIWQLGLYGLQLRNQYGKGLMKSFAGEVGLCKTTLYNYRNMVEFYIGFDEKFHAVEYLQDEYPTLRYEHFKLIWNTYKDSQTPEAGYALLELAAQHSYTPDELQQNLMTRKTGESWIIPAQGKAFIRAVQPNGIVTLQLSEIDDVERLIQARRNGEIVQVKIMVAGVEVNS